MSSDAAGLELRNVGITYGSTVAVDRVSMTVDAGQVVALLGPSGCGKSSLLRAVAGLEPLATGSIHWRGVDLSTVPVHRRNIGFMFQDHALFPHRNVADNIAFGLRMARVPRHARQARVTELLELVGLSGLGERTIGTLSGGQAQRVALARALAPGPDLLLLDEPLGSLDRALRDRLVHEIRRVVTALGITAIHVTHDHDEAVSVADSLALMEAGRLIGFGRVDDLLSTPGDVVTAAALGIDTVWTVVVRRDGTADTPFGPVPVTAPAGATAHVLLRPASLSVVSGSEGGVGGRVVSSRHHGDDWLLTCELTGNGVAVVRHAARLADGQPDRVSADLDQAVELAGVAAQPPGSP